MSLQESQLFFSLTDHFQVGVYKALDSLKGRILVVESVPALVHFQRALHFLSGCVAAIDKQSRQFVGISWRNATGLVDQSEESLAVLLWIRGPGSPYRHAN